ncbi:ABC transporter permease [Nocardioides nitrophenolicus]|uniref:ABC transporter permease n=1 Tax=Nocardioides nitrophenolicus TaxID=60489 RepID=UPI0027DDAEBA|nr:ABC transporter permease [Nocardioides nitrophenolicus]MBM7517102.1 peptide/nickel transport system permease protein [Nocardioides nitrophenolicus]
MSVAVATAQPSARRPSARWRRFALRRARRLLVSLWILVTASFLMIQLVPGDPVRAALGTSAPPELVATRREQLGLDEPLLRQYLTYLGGLLRGDLGESILTQLSVADTIGQRLLATLSLALPAFVITFAIAVPVGVAMAVATRRGRRRRTELGFVGASIVLGSIPEFVLCVALVAVFAVDLGLVPAAGRSGLDSYLLPVLALAVGPSAVLARIVRVEMLAVLDADYVRTARAKRLSALRINLRHALPNAVTATLTLSGLMLASMVAGTVLVENVFAWPGLGGTIVSSIQSRDYPLVQGAVLVYGAIALTVNTLVDVGIAAIDPRSAIGDS